MKKPTGLILLLQTSVERNLFERNLFENEILSIIKFINRRNVTPIYEVQPTKEIPRLNGKATFD